MAEVTQAEKCRVIAEKVMGLSVVMGEVDGVHVTEPYRWPFARTTSGGLAEIPNYFSDPAAMVELMERAKIGVLPSRGSWAATRLGEVYIEIHGPTPMEAVAEAAYQYAMSKENSNG